MTPCVQRLPWAGCPCIQRRSNRKIEAPHNTGSLISIRTSPAGSKKLNSIRAEGFFLLISKNVVTMLFSSFYTFDLACHTDNLPLLQALSPKNKCSIDIKRLIINVVGDSSFLPLIIFRFFEPISANLSDDCTGELFLEANVNIIQLCS